MGKVVPFKPTNPRILKEQRAHRRALLRKTFAEITSPWDPGYVCTYWYGATAKKNREYQRALVFYAAGLGQKRGLLPANLNGWQTTGGYIKDGRTVISFTKPEETLQVPIELKNLDWVPAEPVEETIEELPMAA